MAENTELMTVDNICNRVYVIRGQQVMLDYDLAEIYGYEVKRLNEQVKNNISRFPEDFMFQLTKQEVEYLRSNFSTANINPKSRALPEIKSFSPRNLQYMNQFYRLYSDIEIANQLDAQIFINEITPQVGAQIDKNIVFMIPWGHHKVIMDKCKEDQQKALFFVQKTLENKWSRAVLQNFLDTQLYDRQGKAITNFEVTLPNARSDLAQEITKDPYNFDFITLTQNYNEKELKDALMDNIADFLLELGSGFAFVGREYRIEIGNTENFIDMLFYNIKLHCYVVEVKVTAFEPSFTGQLGTYVVAVNHSLKSDIDAPTLGLLVCKSKDNVQAKYAIESSSQPLGISEYELSHLMPDNFKGTLPTIEEIEAELSEQKNDSKREEANKNF
ncbi:MAG: PDDEXK nuclease domain-containing protein [Lachnospiraceae bacterium]